MKDNTIRAILKMDNTFKPTTHPIFCNKCEGDLEVYYAEERVYVVKCEECGYVGIVKADNPNKAASFFGTEKW